MVLFLFSIGVTKGKWGTLINTLLDFKRRLRPQRAAWPKWCQASSRGAASRYAGKGLEGPR